jgi:hypothetical protein
MSKDEGVGIDQTPEGVEFAGKISASGCKKKNINHK